MNNKRKLICLTPVKNEAWILGHFLECASAWADDIIIADQNSTDGSIEIAQSFPKVHLVHNASVEFNEPERQELLIREARKLGSENILIAVDADEAISANYLISAEWQSLSKLSPGTNIRFRWVNLMPGGNQCWSPEKFHVWGFVDDGTPHRGPAIHSPRVPLGKTIVDFDDVRFLHFQYVDWNRMKSKQRWYMAWERINNNENSTTKLYRTYHHMDSLKKNKVRPVKNEWISPLNEEFISQVQHHEKYWWDDALLEMFDRYGVEYFSKIPIWDQDWSKLANISQVYDASKYKDPRDWIDKKLQQWLGFTQDTEAFGLIKALDYLLRAVGR